MTLPIDTLTDIRVTKLSEIKELCKLRLETAVRLKENKIAVINEIISQHQDLFDRHYSEENCKFDLNMLFEYVRTKIAIKEAKMVIAAADIEIARCQGIINKRRKKIKLILAAGFVVACGLIVLRNNK